MRWGEGEKGGGLEEEGEDRLFRVSITFAIRQP